MVDEGTRVTEITVITVFDDSEIRHQELVHEGQCNHTKSIDALKRVVDVFTLNIADDEDIIDPDIYMLFEAVQSELRILGMQLDMKVHEITLDTIDWE
jgi:hypothetical protein